VQAIAWTTTGRVKTMDRSRQEEGTAGCIELVHIIDTTYCDRCHTSRGVCVCLSVY